jgi:hypothetical protein
MTLERTDFRIRTTTRGYTISQRVGGGWERLADIYPTRAAAQAFIDNTITKNHHQGQTP